MLTTREQALLVWAVLALAVGLLHGPTSRAMGPVLRAFMSPKILVVVALTTAYLASLLWLASRLGLWDRGLLGPTLIWGLPTLLGVGLKAVQAMESEDFFKSSLKGLLSGAVVVEFLVNAETFPLWWELVQLPLIVTIVLLAELSKTDPEHASLRSCMSRVMAIGGTGMLLFSVIALVSKARETAWGDFFQSLGIALWLPLSTLPLIYVLSVVMLKGKALVPIYFMGGKRLPWWRRLGYILGSGVSRRRLRRWQSFDYRRVAESTSFVETVAASRAAAR